MLKLLSSRLQRGAAQKGFVQVTLHVVGQTRKVSLSMGYTSGFHFCHTFPSNCQFFSPNFCISRLVKYCVVTLRTSDLKNEKPWQWQRKLLTGLISITKTMNVTCCSDLFGRFLYFHRRTVIICCQILSECKCGHSFNL